MHVFAGFGVGLWVSAGREQPAPDEPRRIMNTKTLQELATLVEGFDEDHHDYREVRAAKRLVHDLIKANEATK